MKFILFNINDTNKNYINKIQLDDTHYVNEVSLSKKVLQSMELVSKNLFKRLKQVGDNKNIERKILKALESYDKKWYYIPSRDLLDNRYLMNKAQELLGYKLTATNELDNSIFKYVDEYIQQNNDIKKHELKVLVVAKENKNLNISLIEKLIKDYKTVNVYLNEKPSSYILKRIKHINKSEGTTIEIVKKERKVFTEYNVIYFMDDIRPNYPRLRLDKNALVLDAALSENDKFNTNIRFIDDYIQKANCYIDNITNLLGRYNKLELATLIRKIINELDKS